MTKRYAVSSAVKPRTKGEDIFLWNPVTGRFLEAGSDMLHVLQFFSEPKTLESAQEHFDGLSWEDLELLVEFGILVDEAALAFGEDPLTCASPIGTIGLAASYLELPNKTSAADNQWVVIGAPFDLGAEEMGARHGPDEIRQAVQQIKPPFAVEHPRTEEEDFLAEKWGVFPRSYAYQLPDLGVEYDLSQLRVYDVGNIASDPGQALEAVGAKLEYVVDEALCNAFRFVLLGGDHSITRFAFAALARRYPQIGVIHFDAHHDMMGGLPSVRLSHANPIVYMVESERLGALCQIGLRSPGRVLSNTSGVTDTRVRWCSGRDARKTAPDVVMSELPRDIPYYITFDIDCVDPSEAPETGTPEPGGMSYYDVLTYFEYVLESFDIVGADFVEVARGPGKRNAAAAIVARLLVQLVVSGSPRTQIDTFLRRKSR